MNIKKCIFITEVVTILNEAGEEKLKKATSKEDNEYDLDFYDRLGIKPPDNLKDTRPEIDENGFMELAPHELTYDFQNRFIDITDLLTVVEADEFGTVLEFNNGLSYWAEEDLFEIYARIYVTQMSWFERVKESVSTFFGEIRSRVFTRTKK